MKEIFTRVSIRKYQPKPVEPQKITAILRAAMAAPSAGNQQPWEFYVITNPELIAQLSTVSPYSGCAKGAPVVIVSAYREKLWAPMYAEIDMSIAMENLWLACEEQGLGGVWMGIAPQEERMQAVEALIALGYSSTEARTAVSRVRNQADTPEDLIRLALRAMAGM